MKTILYAGVAAFALALPLGAAAAQLYINTGSQVTTCTVIDGNYVHTFPCAPQTPTGTDATYSAPASNTYNKVAGKSAAYQRVMQKSNTHVRVQAKSASYQRIANKYNY